MSEIVIPELNTAFLFRRRPVPIPADLRPEWRIGVVLLLLRNCCRQNRSTFTRVHVLSWAVRTRENQDALIKAVQGALSLDSLVVRIEPSLNRAVDFGIGEGLLRRLEGERVELSPLGIRLADEMDNTGTLFREEKRFMITLGRSATEEFVKRLFG